MKGLACENEPIDRDALVISSKKDRFTMRLVERWRTLKEMVQVTKAEQVICRLSTYRKRGFAVEAVGLAGFLLHAFPSFRRRRN